MAVGVYDHYKVRGKKRPPISAEWRRKLSESHKGKTQSDATKEKRRQAMLGRQTPWCTGEKNRNWKGGITPVLASLRKSSVYKRWRLAVLERDGNTCIWCGVSGARLDVDHIRPFALFPEERFAVENGRTLCRPCHMRTVTYGNVNQFIEYMIEKVFIAGMMVQRPSETAPDFVKMKVSFKVSDFGPFIEKYTNNNGWINIDILESKDGTKLYGVLNQYKPERPKFVEGVPNHEGEYPQDEIDTDSIPF